MLKIELTNLQFHSYHGVFEEETKTGGDYEVDLVVYLSTTSFPLNHMDETIDYTLLYELVKLHMEKPTKLLETLATEIAQEILNDYSKVDEVIVTVKKLNAPIPFFNGKVSAECRVKRSSLR